MAYRYFPAGIDRTSTTVLYVNIVECFPASVDVSGCVIVVCLYFPYMLFHVNSSGICVHWLQVITIKTAEIRLRYRDDLSNRVR